MITLLAALWLQPALAQEAKRPVLKPNIPSFDLATHSYTFPSGLRLLVQPDTTSSTVVVSVVIGGGGIADQKGKAGTAHLLQHLSFQSHGEDELSVQNLYFSEGADYTGEVFAETTRYNITGSVDSLEAMVQGVGHTLFAPLQGVTNEQIAAEKRIMELENYYTGAGIWRNAWPLLFEGIYGKDDPQWGPQAVTLFSESHQIQLSDLEAYAKVNYRPDNVTIVVVGNVDPEEVTSAFFQQFDPKWLHPNATTDDRRKFIKEGIVDPDEENPDHIVWWMMDPDSADVDNPDALTMINPPESRIQPASDPQPPASSDVLYGEALIDTPVAIAVWTLPPATPHDQALGTVTASALFQHVYQQMQPLFEVRKDANNAAQLGCNSVPGAESSFLVCFVYGRDSTVNMESLADRLTSYASVLWDPERIMLRKVATRQGKNQTVTDLLHGLDDLSGSYNSRGPSMALNVHNSGSVNFTVDQIGEANAMDPTEIVRFAETWLSGSRAAKVVLKPIPLSERVALSPTASFHGAVLPGQLKPTEGKITNDMISAALHLPDLSGLKTKTLANNLEINVLTHGEAPLALTMLTFNGGVATRDGLDRIAHASLIYGNVTQGVQAKPELAATQVVGKFAAGQLIDSASHALISSSANLDGALWLMRHSTELNTFNNGGRARWLKLSKPSLKISWHDRSAWARKLRYQHILPDHAAVHTIDWEDLERISDLSTGAIESYQKEKFSPNNTQMWVIGDIEAQTALTQATTYFEGWKSKGEPIERLPGPVAPTSGKPVYLLDAADTPQTVITASCQMAAITHRTRGSSQLIAQIADERLATLLSDEDANAIASVTQRFGAGTVGWIEFTAVVPNDKSGAAKSAMDALIAELSAGDVEASRLQQLKLRYAKQISGNHQGIKRLQAFLAQFQTSGSDLPAALDAYRAGLVEMDGDAVKAAIGSCAEHVVYTVQGPMDTLQANGWQGAEVFDWFDAGDKLYMAHDPKAYKKLLKQRAK